MGARSLPCLRPARGDVSIPPSAVRGSLLPASLKPGLPPVPGQVGQMLIICLIVQQDNTLDFKIIRLTVMRV